uniref:RING-type E3 ubiquitin transferase n=1 Tax=uncultured Chloroflexota bacterium TaxID=166587 RepID=H5SFP8_9CHLR|nr:hypothetical protein HGMM_F22C05C30 [uncultured Chloroflexota bacterium]
MEPMTPQVLLRSLAFLAMACLCGVVPLLFAAIAFYAKGKHEKSARAIASARPAKISSLRPGMGLVRLRGRVAPVPHPFEGTPENGLIYLRLQVEEYVSAYTITGNKTGETPGWKPFTDKWRGIPFQLEDESGQVWVKPEGLDRHFVGDGFVPDEAQIQKACDLLEISPDMLKGRLRFQMWELRAGQEMTVIGAPLQDEEGNLVIAKSNSYPLLISSWPWEILDKKLSAQARQARNWVLFLGIPGLFFLLCGSCGALISLLAALH